MERKILDKLPETLRDEGGARNGATFRTAEEIQFASAPIAFTVAIPHSYNKAEQMEEFDKVITWVIAWVWARDDKYITTRNKHLLSIEHATTISRLKRRRAGGIPVLPEGDEEMTMADYIAAVHNKDWKE